MARCELEPAGRANQMAVWLREVARLRNAAQAQVGDHSDGAPGDHGQKPDNVFMSAQIRYPLPLAHTIK